MQTNGAAIRAIREAKGWNLNPFASHAGIDSGYLSRLERGQHKRESASPQADRNDAVRPARRHHQQRERGELTLNDEPLTFTPEEAALRVGKSAAWLKREAGKRAIPCTRLGRTVSFSEKNLRDLVDGGYCEPASKKSGSRRRTSR